MSDPVSLAALSGTALTEGIRFLYDQAGSVLERRRDRRDRRDRKDTPEIVAEPRVLLAPDEQRANELEDEIRALREDLSADGGELGTEDLLWRADALRILLESVYRTRLVFVGENRPDAEVYSDVEVNVLRGYAAAIRADAGTGSRLRARLRVQSVEAGGEAVGVDLRHDGA
jgi:hypothetical protein